MTFEIKEVKEPLTLHRIKLRWGWFVYGLKYRIKKWLKKEVAIAELILIVLLLKLMGYIVNRVCSKVLM